VALGVRSDRWESIGWGDILNINRLDPSGVGCLLTIGCREPLFALDPKSASFYRRIANHLGAAFRCRRKLAELESPTNEFGSVCVADRPSKGSATGSDPRQRVTVFMNALGGAIT
jgi:hypothetical protein